MAKVALRLVSPATEIRTAAPALPLRRPNSELRTRERYEHELGVRRLFPQPAELGPNRFKDFWR